jgi:membrane protease YdiL (CAAX protease family)
VNFDTGEEHDEPEAAPKMPDSMRKLLRLWEIQPLGLVLFTLVWMILTVPALMICEIMNVDRDPKMLLATVTEAIFAGAAVVALLSVVGIVQQRKLTETGFAVKGFVLETATGYLLGAALISIVISILGIAGDFKVVSHNPAYNPVMAAFLCLFIAVFEETFFRGYMLPSFERRWGTTTALIVSSLLFGAMHLMNVPHESFAVQARVVAFIGVEAGILLSAAFLLTRRLWMPIGIHWAWNFFLGPYYGAPVSGIDIMGSYNRAVLHGPAYITGGKFGPEAGIVALIVCTTAGLALLLAAVKRGQWRAAPSARGVVD